MKPISASLATLFATLVWIGYQSNFGPFLDVQGALFLLIFLAISMVGRFSLQEIRALNENVCDFGIKMTAIGGSIAVIVMAISMLIHMEDTSNSLRPAIALLLLTPFYSLILISIFMILKGWRKVSM